MFKDIKESERVKCEINNTIDQSSASAYNLTRNVDEALQELLELHLYHLVPKLGVFDQKTIPGFEPTISARGALRSLVI